jgi:hypothetical protein
MLGKNPSYLQKKKERFMVKRPSEGKGMHCTIHHLAREVPEVCLEIVRFPHLHTSAAITGTIQFCPIITNIQMVQHQPVQHQAYYQEEINNVHKN